MPERTLSAEEFLQGWMTTTGKLTDLMDADYRSLVTHIQQRDEKIWKLRQQVDADLFKRLKANLLTAQQAIEQANKV